MKILFVLDSLSMGGAERNTAQLMFALSDLGQEVHLCTIRPLRAGQPQAHGFLREDPRLSSLDVSRIYDPRAITRFLSIVAKIQPACIHVEDPYANVVAWAAKRWLGIPAIMTRHVAMDESATAWDRLRLNILKSAAKATYDRVILVADALRDGFCRSYEFEPSKVSTIHNGVAPKAFCGGSREDIRASLGCPSGALVVLMVAVFRPGKGHLSLLEAFRSIQGRFPEARLVYAGDGDLRPRIEGQAADLGDRVIFLGERLDVSALMRAADVVTLPSESEALPTVLMEAAAAGCPVVATNVGGTGEIVSHGITGLLVPPHQQDALAKAIVELLSDAAMRARMASAARTLAKAKFSIQMQAERTLELYKQVTHEGHRPHIVGRLPTR